MKKFIVFVLGAVLVAVIIVVAVNSQGTKKDAPNIGMSQEYNPQVNPADFSTVITNKFFSLAPGKKLVYEGQTAVGLERVEISIPGDMREIVGVKTLVYRDIVTLNGQLVEDTRDYLAQDKEGNVWYFGEDVDNYEGGILKDHHGSWIAGVDGAKPGIWMKANPQVGDTYRQEFYQGQAEDMADVISVSETVVTKRAIYKNCLQTYDYTPLDPGAKEHKYYCPEVGGLVLEENLIDGDRVELVEVGSGQNNDQQTPTNQQASSTVTISFVPEIGIKMSFPKGYSMAKNQEQHRRGSFASYDFQQSGNYQTPLLNEIQFFSEESIRNFTKGCVNTFCFEGDYPNVARYSGQKAAFAQGKDYQNYKLLKFGTRNWFVSNFRCTGDSCIIREYTTFLADTKVDVWIIMSDSSEEKNADIFFTQFKIE